MRSKRAAMAGSTLVAALYPWSAATAVEPLPVEPPIGGPLWTTVMPILLFAVSFLAAYALYRHFSSK